MASACKVLVCGDVNSQFDILLKRLNALQNSAAGPFHVLFIVGPLFKNYEEFFENSSTLSFPIPTYIYDTQGIPTSVIKTDDVNGDSASSASQLPFNLNVMSTDDSGVGMATIMNLTIAYCIDKTTTESSSTTASTASNQIQLFNQQLENIKKITTSIAYRGCDLLLSSQWPMDCHQFLETELLISSGISFGPSSSVIAKLAMQVLPRYHFGIGKNIYFQRPPYINTSNTISKNNTTTAVVTVKPTPCTRFIGLAKVSESKEKEKKYLHALSLTPIIHMTNTDVSEVPIGSTDCPYQPVGSTTSNSIKSAGASNSSVLSMKRSIQSPEPPPTPPPPSASSIYSNTLTAAPANTTTNKRVKVDPMESNRGRFDSIDTSPVPVSGGSGGAFFFGQMGASRPVPLSHSAHLTTALGALPTTTFQSSQHSNIQTIAPNDTIKTLFIGGLSPRCMERDLKLAFPGACKIHRPDGKNFAFVDFTSHSEAAAVIAASMKQVVMINGRQISVGWGKEKPNSNVTVNNNVTAIENSNSNNIYGPGGTDDNRYSQSQQQSLPVQLEPPSVDATCLFVGGLPSVYLQEELLQTLTNSIISSANSASNTAATMGGNSDASSNNKTEKKKIEVISDKGSVAVVISSIRPVLGRSYCFVSTFTHATAAALVAHSVQSPVLFKSKTLAIGWANTNTNGNSTNTSSVTNDGDGRVNMQQSQSSSAVTLVITPPSTDAKTLFAGNIHSSITEADILSFFTINNNNNSSNSNTSSNSNNSISMNTTMDVNKIHVFKPTGKSYAFIDFASHTDALTAMTLSTTAGIIIKGNLIKLGWAKGHSADHHNNHSSGNSDCWFCLASPSIKAHLILSVGEHVYLALPRGAITKNHVLIIPIDCCSSRIMFSADTKKEFHRYEQAIIKFNREQQNNPTECLLFERTLRTRGRDHMQTHLVPLTQQQAHSCLQVFLSLADKYGLRFTEIQGEHDIDDVVLNTEDGGPFQEYFYIQIPIVVAAATAAAVHDGSDSTSGNSSSSNGNSSSSASAEISTTKTVRKFIYVPPPPPSPSSQQSQSSSLFPMMFGLEVAAHALNQPERSNWKHCLLSEAEEEIDSERFKQAFSNYDFTLNEGDEEDDEGDGEGGLLSG